MQRAGARRPMYRSAPARCFARRCVGQLCRKFVRRQIAEARMRAHRVEVRSPALDNHLRFGTRAEPFEAEALIAEFAVEAFRDAFSRSFGRSSRSPISRLAQLFPDRLKLLAAKHDTARRAHDDRPGIVANGATALIAAVGECGRQFRKARDLAAWLGLVPRQNSTGGKTTLPWDQQTRKSIHPPAAHSRRSSLHDPSGSIERPDWSVAQGARWAHASEQGHRRPGEQDRSNSRGPCLGARTPSTNGSRQHMPEHHVR